MCEVRPATAEDFQAFYGRPAPFTLRAIVVVKDGELVGFGGYYLIDGAALVFTDIKPGIGKKDIIRGARETMRLALASGIPLVAQGSEPTSESALKHYGFELSHVADGEHIYRRERGHG